MFIGITYWTRLSIYQFSPCKGGPRGTWGFPLESRTWPLMLYTVHIMAENDTQELKSELRDLLEKAQKIRDNLNRNVLKDENFRDEDDASVLKDRIASVRRELSWTSGQTRGYGS